MFSVLLKFDLFCEENYLIHKIGGGVGKDMVYVICFVKLKCVLGLR